ncbi:TetR/AcrR family transcriptional regulator [Nonomuraea sp. NPDC055795]
MQEQAQRMGRPREGRVDTAIAKATLELLGEVGYARLTMDEVAARAGISKATIYRRHPSKQEMVFAVAIHGDQLPIPDTGTLRGDLEQLARTIVGHLSGPATKALIGLLGEVDTDPGLADRFVAAFIEPERLGNTAMLEQAVRRGELARLPDMNLFHAMFGGTVLAWMLLARNDPEELPERLATAALAVLRDAEQHAGDT